MGHDPLVPHLQARGQLVHDLGAHQRQQPHGALAHDALAEVDGIPGAVVEPALLARFDIESGDTIRLGETEFAIRGILVTEPDRLSSGRFLLGPRVIVALPDLEATGLLAPGALIEHRYRLRLPPDPSLCGASVCGQWAVLCRTPGIALSNAVEFSIAGS